MLYRYLHQHSHVVGEHKIQEMGVAVPCSPGCGDYQDTLPSRKITGQSNCRSQTSAQAIRQNSVEYSLFPSRNSR